MRSLEAELREAMGRSGIEPAGDSLTHAHRTDDREQAIGPPKPGDRIGDFELLTELGRGGMGVVFRAKQVSLNRMVALKLLAADFTEQPDRLMRFRNECLAVAKLSHPSIVPIYAQGQHGSLLYYAMELVEGKSLDHLPAQGDAQRPGGKGEPDMSREWADRFADIAEALHHAHRNNVYHRDVKPANLILDPENRLHILDFGVARIVDVPGLTITGQMVGTPGYLAPEQVGAAVGSSAGDITQRTARAAFHGSAGDHRSDIYALGVTLYEILTGELPHRAEGMAELLRQIAEQDPAPPRRINPAISRDMEAVILRAIRKDPDKRFQSAAELAQELRNIAVGAPVKTRSPGLIERAVRWATVHQAMATLAVASVVLTCALVVTSQYVLLAAGLALLLFGGWWLNRLRRSEARRLVAHALDLLLHETYIELEPVRPLLARAQLLGCDSTDFHVARAITRISRTPEQAADELRAVLSRQPNHHKAMYLLAWITRMEGDEADAERWLARADEIGKPAGAEEYFLRGIAALQIHIEEAMGNLRQAIALRPDFTQALLHLGRALNQWLYYNRKLDHLSEQTTCLESLCLLRPDRAYPRYLLSLAYRLAAETHERLADARATDQTPGEEHRAEARRLWAKAYESAKHAQRIAPTTGRGYAAEAEYFEKQGDHYAAISAWDSAFRYETARQTRMEVHEYRFRLEWWTGQLDRAMWDLEALHMLAPEDPFMAAMYPALVWREWDQPAKANEQLAAYESSHGTSGDEAARVLMATRLLLGEPVEDQLVSFDPLTTAPTSLDSPSPSDLFFAGVTAAARGDRDQALLWLDAAVATYDNEHYTFHALALATKLRLAPDWPG